MTDLRPIFAHAESADRYRLAWQMRRDGRLYKEIGAALGVSLERARQIVIRADRRISRAQQVYDSPVTDPIVYGVWHVFDHDGRERLLNTVTYGH